MLLDSDFLTEFDAAAAGLWRGIEAACATDARWPERAAAAVHSALELAAREPAAADLLTNGAMLNGIGGVARYNRLLEDLGDLLRPGRKLARPVAPLPDLLERAQVGGVALIIAERVARGRAEELPALAPEAVEFLLTPYLGAAEAKRIGSQAA